MQHIFERDPAQERSRLLIDDAGLEKLQRSHVLVAGLGGVGSYAVEALARAGIGNLSLIDGDTIAVSNLNRQLYALRSTVGRLKTEVAAARISEINPSCRVKLVSHWITPENAADFLQHDAAETLWLLDAIDDLPAKTSLLAAALKAGIPALSVLGTGNRLQPFANFTLADISQTHTCPLARALRRNLRYLGIERGVQVIFSPLPPLKPLRQNSAQGQNERQVPNEPYTQKQPPGSISYLPGQAGLLAAGTIISSIIA